MKLFLKILVSVLVCMGLGFLSGLVTMDEIKTWYLSLNKPAFNPPNAVFGPAWTTLYTLMGIAFGIVWHRLSQQGIPLFRSTAVRLFLVQFLLNLAWSSIFFNWHKLGLALLEIIVLWIFILLTIIHFFKISKWSGILLIPYILWVSFATVLTAAIWHLN